ncbi:hypothetical protein SODALDRAFT_380284 [Sodiomyces alkalinus F11]|uniref:Uncharacterized protein n=1 Tax=Sodiomyces alkalinus (strain CBS 110278 / VKM F-3762 / F11) TaxID=1314773 RepID=A0A3N2PQK8_SODAK|nr:hypothetical protein SODALDRAFT_380284 [Sodiomyces alkalinus F11]ROT36793.1 hypothetical protein SODALDRAFT_380284 [Sodiomyces alkalinus F11]
MHPPLPVTVLCMVISASDRSPLFEPTIADCRPLVSIPLSERRTVLSAAMDFLPPVLHYSGSEVSYAYGYRGSTVRTPEIDMWATFTSTILPNPEDDQVSPEKKCTEERKRTLSTAVNASNPVPCSAMPKIPWPIPSCGI